MTEPIVVEVERSGFIESRHLVDVVVVAGGGVVASAGDTERRVAFRSCAKPIQARVCIESGWSPPDGQCLAVACASHYGEPVHLEAVRRTLDGAGLTEAALRCPPMIPANEEEALAVMERASVYNYCSGKHASMLAACVANDWPIDRYREVDHPLQLRIRDLVEQLARGIDGVVVDGCGVPSCTGSLTSIARAFSSIDDGGPEAAAMRNHPVLVGGTGQLDSDLMSVAPHLLVKSGAEGLVCVSSAGYGAAVKIRDGNWDRARGPAIILVLQELGLLDDDQLGKLEPHVLVPVLGGGVPVGHARAVGGITSRID